MNIFLILILFEFAECGIRRQNKYGSVRLDYTEYETIDDTFISLSEGLGMKEHNMLWIFQNQVY